MTRVLYPDRSVDDRARDRVDPAARRDSQVNQRTRVVGKAEQFSGCLVAKCRTRSGTVQHSPQRRLARRLASEDGIAAALQELPAPAAQQPVDDIGTDPAEYCLPAREDAALQFRDFPAGGGQFTWHAGILAR